VEFVDQTMGKLVGPQRAAAEDEDLLAGLLLELGAPTAASSRQ
jgi:hypothetical protein